MFIADNHRHDFRRDCAHGTFAPESPRTMPLITLEEVLACPNLPSLPSVAIEVLNLARKRNVELDEIACVIQNDPALCARILKTVNSSFYGLSKPCPTMTRALAYLGLNTVKSLVLGFSLVDCVKAGDDVDDLQDYWGRSVLSATASRKLANLTSSCDPEEAFLGALMQDIGILAFRRAIGPAYREVIARGPCDHLNLPQLCRGAFGIDHPEVGAALAERWRLPPNLIHAIRDHHCLADQLGGKPALVKIVALSNHLVSAITGTSPDTAVTEVRRLIVDLLELSPDLVDDLISSAISEAQELSKMLKVQIGQYPDIAVILARADDVRMEHELELQREAERLQQTNSDLIRLVLTDALTGAGNRKHFDSELSKSFGQTKAYKGQLALLMIDVDKFKSLNDSLGHQAGDAVLVQMSRRMMDAVGQAGVVCRYGGEEFAISAPGANRQEAARVAEMVRLAIAKEPFDLNHSASNLSSEAKSVQVTASVGVAVFEPGASQNISTPQLLIQAADQAMYAAKAAGRNCVRIFGAKSSAAAA
jgi:two-component system cell cycle response regulator